MAQTRRKRRSKHRGTAVGTIQSRGRTGRKPVQTDRKVAARAAGGGAAASRSRAPSWKNAYIRGFLAALFLFALTRFGLGGDMPLKTSILFAALALAVYVPLGYYMDTFIHQRRQKREAQKSQRR